MDALRRQYNRVDKWARNLSHARYAALLGASSAVGVLVIGLLLSEDLLLVQALSMGVVMFALEVTFGTFQMTEE